MVTIENEFEGFEPRGYTPEPWQGRVSSKFGLLIAGMYFVFLILALIFAIPYLVYLVISILVMVFGSFGFIKGDKIIGGFTTFIGIFLLVFTFILMTI